MKIGFIGCGNMACAMIGGILRKQMLSAEEIIVSDVKETTRIAVQEKYDVCVAEDNVKVAESAEILVLAVKPQFYEEVISDIKRVITDEQIIVTIAPGKTLTWIAEKFGRLLKIVRCMPNTPALIGEGITGVCHNERVSSDELAYVCEMLASCGKTEVVAEHLMDVVVSVSGSSPAYVFMFIEAMADAAVADGMPREQAYKFAAQAILGGAKLVLETGKHPAELKDMVCSPGGTTIEAVRVLEEKGFRSAVIEAMKACAKKAKEL